MNRPDHSVRLSRISTKWTAVLCAHAGPEEAARAAQLQLLQRYHGAVYRYLLGAVRDADAAEELAQEFVLRFVRGDFRRADPQRGRFRNYLRTALIHLVNDYHAARRTAPQAVAPEALEQAASPGPADSSNDFVARWREEVLERTWAALAECNPTYHAALGLRVNEPDLPSPAMAERLGEALGKPINAALARKTLQRAQEKFADLLLREVASSLDHEDELEGELRELDLLRYCRSALQRRGKASAR